MNIIKKLLSLCKCKEPIKQSKRKSIEYRKMSNRHKLCLASEKDDVDEVKALLACGTDVHTNDNLSLLNASRNRHTEIVELLLKYNADVHASSDASLRLASNNRHLEVVKVLIKYGANKLWL